MLTSKVTTKGQVTIPVEVREKLGIREGDVLTYEFDKAGVRVTKLHPFDVEWHRAVSSTLAEEWNSPEDDEAFADLQPQP
jgi:AbrB family looped-hinge helix DNA binding protein